MDQISLPPGVNGRLFATSFSIVGPDPAKTLGEMGADALVCLITDHEIGLRFPDFGTWLGTHGGIHILRLPTPDWGVTDDELLVAMVDQVAAALRNGNTVVTHCGAGLGRTAVLCALVLVRLGLDLATAEVEVRRGRPGSGPDSSQQREQMDRIAPRLSAVSS
jgi:protein tyrosine/serine phosphatase